MNETMWYVVKFDSPRGIFCILEEDAIREDWLPLGWHWLREWEVETTRQDAVAEGWREVSFNDIL